MEIKIEKDWYNFDKGKTIGKKGGEEGKTLPAQVDDTVGWLKSKINEVFDMYELPEDQRDDQWYHDHDRLVHELTID